MLSIGQVSGALGKRHPNSAVAGPLEATIELLFLFYLYSVLGTNTL